MNVWGDILNLGYIISNLLVRKEKKQAVVRHLYSQHLGDPSRRIRSSRPGVWGDSSGSEALAEYRSTAPV